MTVITAHAPYVTLINVFTTSPDRADDLVSVLTEATDRVMRHLPGFLSANIHVSTDGTRVTNYAQWRSEADYRAIFDDPTATAHMAQAARIAEGFDPHLYTVQSVHAAG